MELNTIITAKFATLNKNNTLNEYKSECSKEQYTKKEYLNYPGDDGIKTNWNISKCKVEQYFKLTNKEWNDITNNLLDDNLIFRGKGGNVYTGNNPDFDYDKIYTSEDLLNDFKRNNATLVTVLENDTTGEKIVVDPQEYNYVKYVGII